MHKIHSSKIVAGIESSTLNVCNAMVHRPSSKKFCKRWSNVTYYSYHPEEFAQAVFRDLMKRDVAWQVKADVATKEAKKNSFVPKIEQEATDIGECIDMLMRRTVVFHEQKHRSAKQKIMDELFDEN